MFKSILFTVFSLLCLSVSFLADAKSVSRSDIHSGVSSVMAEMGSTIDSMKKIHSTFVSMADDASNALCAAATKDAAGNITTDCDAVFKASGSIDLSKFGSIQSLGEACTSTFSSEIVAKCAATFSARYENAIKVCGATNASDVTNAIVAASGSAFLNLTGLVTLGKAICTKDTDGSYCINKLLQNDVFADLSKLNNTLQAAICTDCAKKLLNELAAAGGASNDQLKPLLAGLKFVCTTDPTNSAIPCMDSVSLLLKFKGKASEAEISATISVMSDADLTTLCSPCTMSVINSIESIAPLTKGQISDADVQIMKGAKSSIKNACIRDPQKGNGFCPAILKGPLQQWAVGLFTDQATLSNLGVCVGVSSTNCPAGCGGAITQLLSSFSCCLGLVQKEKLATYLPATIPAAYLQIFSNALTSCPISMPTLCAIPTTATLPVTFVLNNLRYAWATGTAKAAVEAALKADVASAFSLDPSAVELGPIINNVNGGVTVTVRLSVDSNVAEGYKATIKSRIEGSMAFAATTAEADKEPRASKVDQTKGVQADPQASTVGPSSTSGAVAANTIVGTVFLTIASLIAMKFY